MDDDKPTRRWCRKKRWWAALVLWLLLAYPLGLGPAWYAGVRGWISWNVLAPYARSVERILPRYEPGQVFYKTVAIRSAGKPYPQTRWFWAYIDWWFELGRRHAASD
jgi:hypothetical protein